MLNDAVSSDHGILQSFLATSFEGLAEAGGILSFTREPAGEPVVSLQVADLALVCHRVLQHAYQPHGYRRERLIPRFIELPRKILSG